MTVLHAIILGIVQGLTEFLPVSSSGHLALVQSLFDLPSDTLFVVVAHLGTLLAVIVAFWKDVVYLFKGAVSLVLGGFKVNGKAPRRLVVMLLIATLPLAVGALIDGYVEAMFDSTLFVGIALMITAVLLFTASMRDSGHKTESSATYADAAFVGIAQLIAVFPGISRSGSTICAGLFRGFKQDFAVRFAFLLSIPAVAGSFVFKLPDLMEMNMESVSLLPYMVGFVASAISGYLAIKLVALLVRGKNLKFFAYYCAFVGALTVVLNLF